MFFKIEDRQQRKSKILASTTRKSKVSKNVDNTGKSASQEIGHVAEKADDQEFESY